MDLATESSRSISNTLSKPEHMPKKNANLSRVSPIEPIRPDLNSMLSHKTPKGFRPSEPNQLSIASPKTFMNTDYPTPGSFSQGRGRSNSLDNTCAPLKPHTGGDVRWDAISSATPRDCPLGLSNFRLLKRLGYGDIGSVYLVELRGSNTFFAMKVMDKGSLASRNKLLRAQTEREILGLLDHPFLPTLYTYFETDKFYCLVMEFCSGGNLHSLRQKQPNKHFTEEAARYYQFLFDLTIYESISNWS